MFQVCGRKPSQSQEHTEKDPKSNPGIEPSTFLLWDNSATTGFEPATF